MSPIYTDTLGFIGGKMGPPQFTPEVLERIRESGVRIVQWGGPHPAHATWPDVLQEVKGVRRQLGDHRETFRVVDTGSDLDTCYRTSLVYVVMGVQNPRLIENKWERLGQLKEAGVRVVQLTYWDERDNTYGCGFWTKEDTGLTDIGKEFLSEVERMNLILDLSHTGPRTAREALEHYTGRVMISHVGCRAVYNHPRNLPDDVISEVAGRDGIIGIYTMTFFLDRADNSTAPWLRHIDHALKLAGVNALTIGSDAPVAGFVDIKAAEADFPLLTASIERGHPIDPQWAPRWPAFIPAFSDSNRFRTMELLLTQQYGPETARKICGTSAHSFYLNAIA